MTDRRDLPEDLAKDSQGYSRIHPSAQAKQHLPAASSALPAKKNKPLAAAVIVPWVLLVALLAGGGWALSQGALSFQFLDAGNTTKTSPPNASAGAWQPPKAQPVPSQTIANAINSPVASYHNAVTMAAQSVVNIYTTQKISNPYANDPFLRRFYEYHGMPSEGEDTNLGSGVIIAQDGYIVTNAHVIAQADNIIVMLNDGRKATARLVGSDPESDLAVIKVDLTGLKPLGFRQTPINVGDVVLAIGNPFGVGQTVTQGIISATGRTGLGINTFENFIQTDAAINPGNSGGALVDAYGQLIGINTAIYSRSGGSMGIGFAIPTETVENVMNSLIKTGRVSRGWLGIELQGRVKDPTKLSDDATGIEVVNVLPDGPAAKAGLQQGDIITALDGQPLTDANSLIQLVARKTPDTTITLSILRGDETHHVAVKLGERQAQTTAQSHGLEPEPHFDPDARQLTPRELLDLLTR